MFTPEHKGQALQKECLDLALLDARVLAWKSECGLFYQEKFPPPNIDITKDGVKFHDRSHVLLQDYLGQSSWDLRSFFGEESLPSIYEEILTVFCARITHRFPEDPRNSASAEQVSKDIDLLRYLDYLGEDSDFIGAKNQRSTTISDVLSRLAKKEDFRDFQETLLQATSDCLSWDDFSLSELLK